MSYCYTRRAARSFSVVEGEVRTALKNEGFGVITEIDAQKTVKEKLGEEMLPYKILGACNPHFAHQAINAEPDIGVLLPCNIVIRQDEQGVVVSAILPTVQIGKVSNPALAPIASEVERSLKKMIDVVVSEI